MTRLCASTVVNAGTAVILLAGCAAPPPPRDDSLMADDMRQQVLKVIPAPPQPPPAPTAVAMTIDPALRERAKSEILSASRSNDPVLRANAMEAAQTALGPVEGASVVLAGLNDQRALVRFAASMAAGGLRLEAARPRLLELARSDPDESVAVGTRYALHRLGDFSLSHDLERYALSNNLRTRANTALALGLLGERSALRVLRPMLNGNDDPVLRMQIAEAMWRLGDQDGLKLLVAGVVSQFPDDQIISVLALAATRDERAARPYALGKLTTPYDEVNLAAARALGMVGDDAGYGVALKGVGSADPRQRHLAALALGAIGRSDAQPHLAKLLSDAESPVRLAAAMAMYQLKDRPGSQASVK